MTQAVYKHTVSAECQGDHQVDKPLDLLQEAVRDWINNMFRDYEKLHFHLQVLMPIRAARGIYGVWVISLLENQNNTLHIRIHPKGLPAQWRCYLICPDEETANAIFEYEKPKIATYMEKNNIPLTEDPTKLAENRKEARRFRKDPCNWVQISRMLQKKEMLRKICYELSRLSPDDGLITKHIVWQAIKQATGKKFDLYLNDVFVHNLMEMGILDPAFGRDETRYVATSAFISYYDQYIESQHQQTVEQLRNQLLSKTRLRTHKEKEISRLQIALEEANKLKSGLDAEIASLEIEIKKAESLLSSD